jgi:hypothetical protein
MENLFPISHELFLHTRNNKASWLARESNPDTS